MYVQSLCAYCFIVVFVRVLLFPCIVIFTFSHGCAVINCSTRVSSHHSNKINGNNNMQFLYSASSLPKLAQSALHIIIPGRPDIHHLLNSLGSIHPLTHFKAPRVIYVQLPSRSIARYSFTAEWTEAPLSPPVAHSGHFLMSRLALAGLKPTILWLGVQRANHSAITTRRITKSLANRQKFSICNYSFEFHTGAILRANLEWKTFEERGVENLVPKIPVHKAQSET